MVGSFIGWVEDHKGYSSVGTGGLLLRHGAKTILLTKRALRLMGVSQRNVLLFCHKASGSQKNIEELPSRNVNEHFCICLWDTEEFWVLIPIFIGSL